MYADLVEGVLSEFGERQRAYYRQYDSVIPEWAARQIATKARSEKRRYDARRAAGVCVHCGADSGGRTLCRTHAVNTKARSEKRRYDARRLAGVCTRCGADSGGKALCRKHSVPRRRTAR